MDIEKLTAVFGWMSVINLGVYLWAAAMIILARDRVVRLQAWMTGVPEAEWPGYYVDYLSRYKIGIIMFNLAPYFALRIVG